jgi:hypothetical protein
MKAKLILFSAALLICAATFAQPVGTIVAFSGQKDKLPAGWLICDGTIYDRGASPQYNALFQIIGTSWGGNGANKFAVPDLRGLFLRGLSDNSGIDVDANTRENSRPDLPTPGSGQNTVGSKQSDSFKSHKHTWMSGSGWVSPGSNHDANGGSPYARNDAGYNFPADNGTQLVGGNETRPKNAYVLYIIKYQ